MAVCLGNTVNSCCYVEGELCRFLRDDGVLASRRWICTLREQLGSWEEVHNHEGYKEHIQPVWERLGVSNCGEYPRKGEICGECGKEGE